MAGPLLRLVFSRLAPVPGAVAQNRRLVIRAVTKAARSGAGWITTPELAVSAYTFDDTLGTDWIEPQPDHSMSRICRLAARLRVTLFLSPPGKTPRSRRRVGTLHKRQGAPLFVSNRTGQDRTLDSRQAEHGCCRSHANNPPASASIGVSPRGGWPALVISAS
ncbi:MAG: hypothetical protein GDA65_00365 [Nitrospira sp. CR1.1]|nr:hypothetical protein [Nitrospira sp. CR1.1]